MPRRLILRSQLALGDIVCFTAAIRELHRQYPGQFITDVRTPFPELWEFNPNIVSLDENDDGVEVLDVHYDRDPYYTVHRSNEHAMHLIDGYCQDLANILQLPSLRPQELKGHIYLSQAELNWKSLPHDQFNTQRYWIICAGGKMDFPVKHWHQSGFQRVVDYFSGHIQFVQIGADYPGHRHTPLEGVINLVGQTSVRQLIRLVHSACGVLCGITGVMHLAAAVPTPVWQHRPRPCVVVAGGREPRSWYGYQRHRILETVGELPCCRDGGCWKSHVVPPGESQKEGETDLRLCERVVNNTPKCMAMIRPEAVILEIEKYLESQGVE